MNNNLDHNERSLMIRIVKKYYELGINQEQIAKEEFMSKSSVCRVLKKALNCGYIKIEVNCPTESVQSLEQTFKDRFGLEKITIIPTYTDIIEYPIRDVCKSLAIDLLKMINPDDILSLSWGNTIETLANMMSTMSNQNKRCLKVVMLNGSFAGDIKSFKSGRIIEQMAEIFSADGFIMPVPMVVDTEELAEQIKNDSHVKYVLDIARASQISVFSIGTMSSNSVLNDRGIYSRSDYEMVVKKGGLGLIAGRCLNINGEIVEKSINARTIGLTPDEIRSKKRRIGIAIGIQKAPAILAALRSTIINCLYTDEVTAQEVLNIADKMNGGSK